MQDAMSTEFRGGGAKRASSGRVSSSSASLYRGRSLWRYRKEGRWREKIVKREDGVDSLTRFKESARRLGLGAPSLEADGLRNAPIPRPRGQVKGGVLPPLRYRKEGRWREKIVKREDGVDSLTRFKESVKIVLSLVAVLFPFPFPLPLLTRIERFSRFP
jgi:hypothetical protein